MNEVDLADYSRYDGVGLADLVKGQKVSPKELADLAVEALEKVNPKINAVIEVFADRVEGLKGAAIPSGPFGGVPFLMKDIGAGEAGRKQECGSRLMKANVVQHDAFLTTRFRAAGLTLLGRTTTPEFALGPSTESALSGDTRNPWSPDRMAGGSSGGSAAAVAAGIVPMAHASDNGGSIRIPASACGLVGLKPSRGRVTLGPDIGEDAFGMLQEFCVSRTVRDTAAMLDAVGMPAPGDPFVIPQPVRPFAQEVGASVRPMRIAWTADSWQPGATTDPEIIDAVDAVVAVLEKAGHTLVHASPAFDYETYFHAIVNAWAFGLYAMMDLVAGTAGRALNEETLEPVMLSFYEYSKTLKGGDLLTAGSVMNGFRRTFGEFFTKYDLLITPTLVKLPEPLGTYSKMRKDVDYVAFMRENDSIRIHPPAANVTGQPAISLPLGWSRFGLPIGVQFMARFAEEGTLLRLASWFEKTMPWRDRIPPVHASR